MTCFGWRRVREMVVMLLLWMQRLRATEAFSLSHSIALFKNGGCTARQFAKYATPLLSRKHLSVNSALFATLSDPTAGRTVGDDVAPQDDNCLPTILLKRSRQSKSFRNGNQLVFTKAIQRVESGGDLQAGQLVRVKVEGEKGQQPMLLGWGVYNPNSLYRVRILCHRFLLQKQAFKSMESSISNLPLENREGKALGIILRRQFSKAWKTRQALQLIPTGSSSSLYSLETDTFRLLNGEGDNLSGLAADVIGGDTVVIMSSAAWCEVHKTVIMSSLQSILPSQMNLVWKTTPSRLTQDGYKLSVDDTTPTSVDDENKMIISMENGVRYATWPYKDGQKTGVYCDQRENRFNLAQYCHGKRVLDLCCYHGGFSLNALVHGNASHATGVDSSQEAIDVCHENVKLNEISANRVHFVRSDIADFLRQRAEVCDFDPGNDHYFDVVVLDPPKLAPSANVLEKARRKYHSFNRDALKLIDPQNGGLLLTCTCSAAMSQEAGGQYFLTMVQGAALASGRDVTLLKVFGAASCHTQSPICWPAGSYLTAALFRVHPTSEDEEY
mmetsp:Transcript_2451/g.6815  ORF Transcript_2451/g.6815 Transcript_2451/m.6815 type:complete len:556 (+) Transcript_2451:59-1726(+)